MLSHNLRASVDRYKQRNIIVMAIYLDKHKPNFEDFFVPFGRKVRKWSNLPRGMELSIGGVEFAFQPRMICHASDTPARAAASGIKASGFYPCFVCDMKGFTLSSLLEDCSKNHHVVLPPRASEAVPSFRTVDGWNADAAAAFKSQAAVRGIQPSQPMTKCNPGFNHFMEAVAIMHQVESIVPCTRS